MRGKRTTYKHDGTPHIINELGRTCSVGGDYHPWSEYRIERGRHVARCCKCANRLAIENRHRKVKRQAKEAKATPLTEFLSRKWI